MINRKVILILAAFAFPLNAGEIPEKAERYRTMLLKKPENPVLFGRMLDAWLEEKELEALKPELEERAKAGAAADWRLLAVYHEHSGDEAAALKALDEAVKLAPEDAATRLARGKALGVALRFDAALDDLAVAAKDKTLGVEAGTLRGKMLARAGRPGEAVKAWQELIAANPADEGLKEDLVELEIGEGMLDEAVTAARELAEKTDDPYKKALRRLQVAEILAQAGKKEDSLKEYRDVFAVSAEGSWLEREVLARAGALFSREDDSAGLKEFLGGLRESYPRRVAVKKEAAKSLLASGEQDEAIAMFREVLKVLPGDREVREEFIGLLEGAERPKEAADELVALLETAKQDVGLWERLATLRKTLKDEAGLTAALDKALALTPEDEAGLVARARLLERFEKFDGAEKILRDAMAKHGKDGEAGEALATFLVSREKGDEAVALWKEMAAGADREGLMRIARSLSAHGKSSEAFAMLQPRVKDFPDDPLLLAALCQAAQLSDTPEAAVPQAMELVRQAKSPTDLDTALKLASGLIARAEEPKKWLDQLSAKPDLTLQERCLLSEIHETLGDSIAAEQVLKDAMAADDSLLAATQRVRLHEIRGDMDEAVAAMREMMALPGGTKTAHVKKLVELLERAGDSEKALAATDEWLKLAPGDKLAWTKRAELYLGDGRPAEAVAELRRALAKFGGEEELREKLAEAQREAGMMEEAWRSFTALYDEAESPASKLKWAAGLARMAEMEGKEEELISDFRRRSRDNPSSPLPLLALADMYREWMLTEEELKCVEEAARRKPDDSQLKFRIADLQETAGNMEASAEILRGMMSGADAPEARRRLSAFWIRQGETERGLRELAEGGKSTDPRAVEKLVMPLARAKEWEAAATVLAREVLTFPEDWRLSYMLAVVLLEAGKIDEAMDRFATLLEADGDLKHAPPVLANRYGNPYGYPYGHPGMNPTTKKPTVTRKAMPEYQGYQSQIMSAKDPDRYGYYAGMQPGEIFLPASADAMRRMALAQLMIVARDNEEKRAAIVAKVSSSHFEDLETFKKVFFLKPEEMKELVMSEKASADDFRWYFQTASSNNSQNKPDPDFARLMQRGVDLMEKDDPEFALWMASRLPLDGDEGAGEKGARQRIDLFKTLPAEKQERNCHQLQTIAFAGDKVPKELKKEAEDLFIAQMEKSPDGITGNYLSFELASRWMRDGQIERGIEWLNRLNAEMKKDPKKAQLASSRYRGMYSPWGMGFRGGGRANAQSYPEVLQELSPQLSNLLGGTRSQGGMGLTDTHRRLLKLLGESENGMPGQPQVKPLDTEALAALTGKLDDRISRVCIYEQAGKSKEVEREVAEIEAAASPSIEELLLASCFHAKKSPEKSYALLLKAREVPDAGLWRDRVEQEIVTTGVALAKAKTEGVDLEPAKRAALRLRKGSSYNPELKGQVAAWLKDLGLEDESKRYLSGPASGFASRAMRNRYGSGSRMMSPSRRNGEDVARLVKDGKRDAAARLLLGSLRQSAGTHNSSYERDRVLSQAKSLKLDKELILVSAPAEGASYARRLDHAMLLMSLEKKEEAGPLLRKLAEEKPDDLTVKTALYSVLKPEEQLKQAKELAKGDFDEDVISVLFSSWVEGNSASKRLDALEAMAGLLENLEPSFKAERNLSWVNYMMVRITTDDYMDVQMTPLFRKAGESNNYNKEVSKRREDLCKKMFRAMILHPQTTEQGFVMLAGTRDVLGAADEELDAAALGALRLVIRIEQPEANRRFYGNRRDYMWSWIRGNGSSSGGGAPQGLMPSAWLAKRAKEGKVLEPYDKEFLLSLSKENGDWAKIMETCEEIAKTPGVAKFDEWKKANAERPMDRGQQVVLELEWISRAAAAAKREDLRTAIEDFMCEALRQGTYDSQSFSRELSRTVEQAKDPQARSAELHRFAIKILGPEEAWPLYAEMQKSGIYLPGPNQRINAFQNLFSSFNGNPATAVCAMRFVSAHGLANMGSLNWYQILDSPGGGLPKAETLLDSGYFSPGPDIVANAIDGNGKSMLDYGLNRVKQRDGSPKLGEELMKVDGPDRFWARIFGAVLANKPQTAYAELDRQASAIGKWTPEERQALWSFVGTWLPDAAKNASASVKKQLAENLKVGDIEARKKAEEYLKDGLPPTLQPYSSDSGLQPLVARLAGSDPELAAKLWNMCLEHMSANARGWSSSSGGYMTAAETYAHSQLMDSMISRGGSLRDLLGFLAAFDKQPASAKLGQYENNFSYYLDRIFREDAKVREAEVKKVKVPAGLPANAGYYALLAKETPKELRGIMGALVISRMRYQSSWDYSNGWREKLSAWTDGDLKKADPSLANAVHLAVMSAAGNRLDDTAKAELRASFAAFVSAPGIPADLKFATLAGVLHNRPADHFDDPACAKAMVDFLSTFLTPERPWAGYVSVPALNRFASWKSIPPEDAKKLLAAFEKSRIDYANGSGDEDKARGAISSLNLSLALRAGDAESIARAVRSGSGMRGRLDLMMKLWQGGLGDSAKLLIARPGEFHQGLRAVVLGGNQEDGDALPAFSKEIEAALKGWVAVIEDPTQRFRMECLVSCLPDAKDDAAPSVKRADRLAALAKRFAAEAPKSRASRMEALAALSVEAAASQGLLEELETLTKGVDMGSLVLAVSSSNYNGTPVDREEQAVQEALLKQLTYCQLAETGDPAGLARQVESIQLIADGNNEYYATQQMDRFFDPLAAMLVLRIHELDGEKKKAGAAQALKICEHLLAFNRREMQRDVIPLGIMSQVAAGDGSAFDRWLEGLPEDSRKRYDEVRKQYSLAQSFPMLHEPTFSEAAYEKPRRELLAAMLSDDATLKREIKHPTDLSALLDSKAFTREDIFAAVDGLPAEHPMKAKFLTEKAGIIGWRTDEKENAIKGFDAADAAAKASGDAKSIAYARAYRAKWTDDREKKPAEAAAIAKEIKLDDLDEKERKWMQDLINKAAEKK
ncbi:hypothetical protein OKA04_23055 [Luteolibacter flavescens]|uniref:Tetratricopeptide repeat protein n=1 Tax=Luteolibacter flavescens TaxID=1859460 RepID=A0ABT3FXA3_9BACT|nr:hypothetical protein [Luteolibacter flavescens]MCW1887635.1 hypothetical protein [Luteolibacter flavescens]